MKDVAKIVEDLLDRGQGPGIDWSNIMLHRNAAALPSDAPGDDSPANRGFDFIVADDAGRPTHLGRCRNSADPRARREADIRAHLAMDADVAHLVLETRRLDAPPLLVEISPYFEGPPFDPARGDPATQARDTERILAAVACITASVGRGLPALARSANTELLGTAGPSLERLSRHGLGTDRRQRLEYLMNEVTLASELQHGDLWPQNVLVKAGRLVIVDFDDLGDVHVPLYDAFHFLRNCLMARQSSMAITILDLLAPGRPDAGIWHQVVRRERERLQLESHQVIAAFTFYLVHFTARLRDRDGPKDHWTPYWRCLEALGDASDNTLLRISSAG